MLSAPPNEELVELIKKEVLSNWLARQTVILVSYERVGSSPTTSTISINSITELVQITGKITIGSLPALDAGGCRFESCFSDNDNL